MKRFALLLSLLTAWLAAPAHGGPAGTFEYKGTVLDAAHHPVPGAVVECYHRPDLARSSDYALQLQARCTTDAQGKFLCRTTNSGLATFIARKPGLSLDWKCWSAREETDEAANALTLTAPAAVSGRVQAAGGKPVAGAEVWVRVAARPLLTTGYRQSPNLLYDQEGHKYLATRSGADGAFRIDGLPADASLELAAAKPGLALNQESSRRFNPSELSFQAGQTNILLTLAPAGVIEGQVVEEKTGVPIPGARVVTPVSWFGPSTPPALTGPDGCFRLPDLAAGEYPLQAMIGTNAFPDRVCETVSATVAAGQTNRAVTLTATRGGVLEVTVQDGAEHALEGVTVSAYSASAQVGPALPQSADTAQRGIAQLRLCPGDYALMVSREGWRVHHTQVSVEAGQTNRQAVTLEPCPQVSGQVLDPEGKPAAKVAVLLSPFGRGEKRTDAQGRFTVSADVPVVAATQHFPQNLVARDAARNLAAALPLEEGTTNFTLKLEPGLALAGRVTDPAGQPITRAQVQVMLHIERSTSSLGAPATTDAAGRFELAALPAGSRYTVIVSASGFGRRTSEVEPAEGKTGRLELEPFQLPVANLPLAGVVLDAEDKPVAGASLYTTRQSEQPQLNGRTDAQGRFRFDQVCAGPIQLNASTSDGSYGTANVEGGDTNVTIRLEQGRAVRRLGGGANSSKFSGSVLNPEGQPAANVNVFLLPHGFMPKKTDAQGRFTLTPPNYYGGSMSTERVVVASDPVHNLAAALDVELAATNADLKLEPAWSVASRVTDLAGKPLTNAQVQVLFWTGNMGSTLETPTRVEADGRFEVKGLVPDRRYSINVVAKGYGRVTQKVESPEAGTRRVELEPFQLAVANQRVAGVVLDTEDKPVANATVMASGDKQPNLNTQTDSKGRFVLEPVCAGAIRLFANGSSGSFGNVSTEGGDINVTLRLGSARTVSRRGVAPRAATLQGKPLPDLAALGVSPAQAPADRPVLVVLIDAEQRPSRRVLRLLAEQAPALQEKGVAVVVLQTGEMTGEALSAWKTETAVPFPVVACRADAEKARATWGAASLPWLLLADKTHRVAAEGFGPEELAAKLKALSR
jgi:uncharacterized GH25 family protein/protocatechuate 3,4-dioxygenase beta subunit